MIDAFGLFTAMVHVMSMSRIDTGHLVLVGGSLDRHLHEE